MEVSSSGNKSTVFPVLDDGNYYIQSNFTEDSQLGQHFWNFLTKPESKPPYEEFKVESGINASFRRDSDDNMSGDEESERMDVHFEDTTLDCSYIGVPDDTYVAFHQPQDMIRNDYAYYSEAIEGQGLTTDYSYIEVPQAMASDHTQVPPATSQLQDDTNIDHAFVQATKDGNWTAMKKFLELHARVLTAKLFRTGTALHHAIDFGKKNIAESLVDEMTPNDLEIRDRDGHTPLALGANYHYPGIFRLLDRMIKKNPKLPNLGDYRKVPVVVASWKGFKDTTRFLYKVTDKNILSPAHDYGKVGVQLLNQCINIKLFDIASELAQNFPKLLHLRDDDGVTPIQAMARTFTAHPIGIEESVSDESRAFLRFICKEVSTFDVETLTRCAYAAMVEAAKRGNVEFIVEMLEANPDLLWAKEDGKTMFWHAIMNRQEKVFNLIYGDQVRQHKDSLLSCNNDDRNNILHFTAMLPPQTILDRLSGPALQMQREFKWFKEVREVAKSRYPEDVNKENLTPRALFTRSHKNLLDAAEKSMKATAQSATTVGALIITMMFAATFTVPRTDSNQTAGHPLFVNKGILTAFIVFDALSLNLSITSVLVFLGILTSRYSEEDFLVKLPRKLTIGLSALFLSITTMMVTFCVAVTIMFGRQWQFVVPVVLLACATIGMFVYSVLPLLREILVSPYGPSIFDKNRELREMEMEESEEKMLDF